MRATVGEMLVTVGEMLVTVAVAMEMPADTAPKVDMAEVLLVRLTLPINAMSTLPTRR
jgi:hypothetical protein